MGKGRLTFIFIKLAIFISCKNGVQGFTLIGEESGFIFENKIDYTENFNPYIYRNFYNGGGVAVGDVNNDGLEDIYLTGNLVANKLFINKGNFEFIDITDSAGVACPKVWSTGATFVDINNDGFLDLYVCKSGPPDGENRKNQLFINNGDLTFTDQSEAYNLDILGLSVHAAFFDYDKDGDLDCYILNNSFRTVGGYDLIKNKRLTPDPSGMGNKLLENIDGYFTDVTERAGIYSSEIGFGLGITLSDFNNDGWTDLFISNDFFEKDYLYINQKDKTFKEVSDQYFSSLSLGSMGADSADLDNDLLTDLFVTEMLPKSFKRKKTKAVYDSWDKHDLAVSKGYHYQYPRNVLQKNSGNNNFFEIGRFSNLSASDWSWASMMLDLNNDGLKDIIISNGIYKDLLDRDYLNYMSNQERISNLIKSEREVIKKLIDIIPSNPVKNQVYFNKGDFVFEDVTDALGFGTKTFSNGLSFSDLDNDGNLDIIINNVNMPAMIYRNNLTDHKSISFLLVGDKKNPFAIGSKVVLSYDNGKKAMLEHFPSRGFQSSVTYKLHFGIGDVEKIDSVYIFWPDNKTSLIKNLSTNKTHIIDKEKTPTINFNTKQILNQKDLSLKQIDLIEFTHKENKYIDFNKERLLIEMSSNEGPYIATSDLNNDGKDDIFITGAKNQSSSLFISEKNHYKITNSPFDMHAKSEDVEAYFFDSDNDGDQDLFVASGGKSFSIYDQLLHDRLYINDGANNFTTKANAFNFKKPFATGSVAISDFNNDGLQDIFLGERFSNEAYGIPVSGHIFKNIGNNQFIEYEQKALQNLGLITDAKWNDINKDGYLDLIIVGEWMPITILINNNGVFENKTEDYNLSKTRGLWKAIEIVDLNCDGQMDFIASNIGKNTFYKPGMKLFVNDFDSNGTYEQLFCEKVGDKYYPMVDKDELISQLPSLKKKLVYYKDYAELSMEEIFDKTLINSSVEKELDILETLIFINEKKRFIKQSVPEEINYSVVYDIELYSQNNNCSSKILFGGNQKKVKPQFGKHDASLGWLLETYTDGNLVKFKKPINLNLQGDIRKFTVMNYNDEKLIFVGLNDDEIKIFQFKN